MNITDLPIGILTHVASFLPKPSRSLFAVSLTAPSSSWKGTSETKELSETSKAIMSPSSQWKILDFEEVEKSLAKKLNDDDLYAVLTCTKQTVKRLKLAGCTNITGWGLTPLQFSTVLELIDLSLLKQHEDSSTRLESKIRQEVIISVQGCSLKYIQFPYYWTRARSLRLVNFEERYMEHLVRLGISCSKCNNDINIRGLRFHFATTVCNQSVFIDHVSNCFCCNKFYCSGPGCVQRYICQRCDGVVSVCMCGYKEKCFQCSDIICKDCHREGYCIDCWINDSIRM